MFLRIKIFEWHPVSHVGRHARQFSHLGWTPDCWVSTDLYATIPNCLNYCSHRSSSNCWSKVPCTESYLDYPAHGTLFYLKEATVATSEWPRPTVQHVCCWVLTLIAESLLQTAACSQLVNEPTAFYSRIMEQCCRVLQSSAVLQNALLHVL